MADVQRGKRGVDCKDPWHKMGTAQQEGEPFFGACPASRCDDGNAESIRGLTALANAPRLDVRKAPNPLRAAKPERLDAWRRDCEAVAKARRGALA